MPVETRTGRLDTLFAEWADRFEGERFMKDGIIHEDDWDKSRCKVLVVLKEDNNCPSDDLRKECREKPWPVPGSWSYGLQQSGPGKVRAYSEASKDESVAEGCRSLAILNLKKSSGGPIANPDTIRKYALRDADLIRREMEIINPDIIICGGTFSIFREIFKLDSTTKDGEMMHLYRGKPVIDFCHPSARRPHEEMFSSLMELCQAHGIIL